METRANSTENRNADVCYTSFLEPFDRYLYTNLGFSRRAAREECFDANSEEVHTRDASLKKLL